MGACHRAPSGAGEAQGLTVERTTAPRLLARRSLATLVVGVTALSLAACSSSTHAATVTTTTTVASTSTTIDANASAALAVWRDYVTVSQQWLNPPNPADNRIGVFIAASSVEDFRGKIAVEKVKGIANRPGPSGPPEHHPKVKSSSSKSVLIHDCFIDDSVTFSVSDGHVIDDAVVTRTIEASLVPEAGTWKVLRIDEQSKLNGRVTCD